jgi:hypothetical protein
MPVRGDDVGLPPPHAGLDRLQQPQLVAELAGRFPVASGPGQGDAAVGLGAGQPAPELDGGGTSW